MATNLKIEDRLLNEARKMGGFKTKRESVNRALAEFIEHRVQMLGIIRQELLSGIRKVGQFRQIERILEGFRDLLATSEDHLTAARFFNDCKRRGIQGSAIDFLICAQAYRNGMSILTTDDDFLQYSRHLPIKIE